MTQNNPYKYDKDLDADIFETEAESKSGERSVHRHTIDGSVCHTCKVVHAIDGMPDNVPSHVMEQVLTFLDRLPDEILRGADGLLAPKIPPHTKVVVTFLDFLVSLDIANHEGPMMRAIIDHIDYGKSSTNITSKWEVYDCERRIMTSFIALKAVNNHLEEAKAAEASATILSMLDLLTNFMVDRIALIVEKYKTLAESIGYEPDQSIINNGTYGDAQKDLPPYMVHTMIEGINNHLSK